MQRHPSPPSPSDHLAQPARVPSPTGCRLLVLALTLAILSLASPMAAQETDDDSSDTETVSFYEQIRPVFQAHCQGCHQPAKRGGDYVMTDFESLLLAGESDEAAIVPGKPDESYLMVQIEIVDGAAEMPKDKPPLSPVEVELIRTWIQQGAVNDTPATAVTKFDAEHPPTYPVQPVVTSLAVSSDGRTLAVAGYHEALIYTLEAADDSKPTTAKLTGRLVGLSERIESISFSPDGASLALAGGSPGRFGEIQVWDVATQRLTLSKMIGFDTLYGASWSSDSNLLAFGCPDATIRAIDPRTGDEKLFNGAHDDWVLDTVFSKEDDYLISVGRDRSMKLVNVETQRFIDNITSITPGALKGGLNAVARHPADNRLLCGGADGVPKIYKMLREKDRKIGDDFNLIRAFAPLEGRVMDVDFSTDGGRILSCSSVNGHGQVRIDQVEDGATVVDVKVPESGLYCCDFSPDGQWFATAGFDGIVRLYTATDGTPLLSFPAAPITNDPPATSSE